MPSGSRAPSYRPSASPLAFPDNFPREPVHLMLGCVVASDLRIVAYRDFRFGFPETTPLYTRPPRQGPDIVIAGHYAFRPPSAQPESSLQSEGDARGENGNNDYLCMECSPCVPSPVTRRQLPFARDCGEGSLGVARFCEWCGTTIRRISGQSLTYRCPYDSGRVVACLCSSGDRSTVSMASSR